MTATTIPFRDGTLTSHQRRMDDDGAGNLAAINLEAPEQRAALIAALGLLATATGQEAMRLLLAAGATSAKQDTGNTSLAAIVTALATTLKVQTPTPSGVVAGQLSVAANAAAAALPAAALVNGIVVKASASNTATVFVGGSNLATGVGGYPLAPGEAMSFAVANASALYFISTAASVVYFGGN